MASEETVFEFVDFLFFEDVILKVKEFHIRGL